MKRFKMRVFAGVLLTLMLVTLGDARAVRHSRQSKGDPQVQEGGIDHSQEKVDDRVKDPDWLPTADDYVEEGEELEDDDEDTLWSSDVDPDWTPEDHDYDENDDLDSEYEDEDEEARLNEILFDIALLLEEREGVDAPDSDRVSEIFQNLTKLHLSIEDASEALEVLEAEEAVELLEAVEAVAELQAAQDLIDEEQQEAQYSQQAAGIIKTKRQTKSQNQISQQSGQIGQGEVGRVQEVNEDDVKKDPDWLPTADDYIQEEEEDYPEYDSYEETEEGEEVEDDEEDALWSSDDDPDWKPEDHDYDDEDEDTRLNEILFDMALIMVKKSAVDDPNSDEVFQTFQGLQKLNLSIEDALEALILLQTEQELIDQEQQESQQNQQAAGIIKTKRQTKSQIQQSGQNGRWEVGQRDQVNQDDVAVGVEPLSPEIAVNPYEVGAGVEAVDSESEGGSSFLGWLGDGWGRVVDAANTVSDHVEETFDDWGNKISDATGNVQDAASTAVDAVQDAANTAGESIVSAYHHVSGKIPELRERIQNLFTRFGVLVATGADYCIQHMEHAVDQIKEAEILDKLQQKLAEGNEDVIAFFQLVGEKVTSWKQIQGQLNVDSGLIIVPGTEGDDGQVVPQPDDDDEKEQVVQQLDVYQDKDVVQYLDKLVSSGVLTQEEMDLLSQQQNQQQVDFQQQNNYQQEPSAIQVQSSL